LVDSTAAIEVIKGVKLELVSTRGEGRLWFFLLVQKRRQMPTDILSVSIREMVKCAALHLVYFGSGEYNTSFCQL